MAETTKETPVPCIIAINPDNQEAVAIPLDLAAWDDDVIERVVEAMAEAEQSFFDAAVHGLTGTSSMRVAAMLAAALAALAEVPDA